MLLLGGVIIEIAIAVAFLAYYFNTTIFATRLTAEALAAAQAGVDDAIIRVVLNKNCPDSSCPSPYTLTVNRATTDVTICKDTCAGVGKHEITSTGNSLNKKKKLRAVIQVDSTTGEVRTESITEVAL